MRNSTRTVFAAWLIGGFALAQEPAITLEYPSSPKSLHKVHKPAESAAPATTLPPTATTSLPPPPPVSLAPNAPPAVAAPAPAVKSFDCTVTPCPTTPKSFDCTVTPCPTPPKSFDCTVAPSPSPTKSFDCSVTPCPTTTVSCPPGCLPAAKCTRIWGEVEYLLWWTSDSDLPPLLTTGNPLDPVPGAIGQPGTRILYGGDGVDFNNFSGLRLSLGGWVDEKATFGLEGSYLILERKQKGFGIPSDAGGNPPLYFSVFRPDRGGEGSFTISSPLAFPGVLQGSALITASTHFWGAEVNGLANLLRTNDYGVDVLIGFRYLDLLENLDIAGLALFDPVFNIRQETRDHFGTRNQFYGGQVGARMFVDLGGITAGIKAQVALGSNRQRTSVNGVSTQFGPGVPNGTFAGGIYALPTNIGVVVNNSIAVVPQIGISVGFDLVEAVRVTAGYDFLYWNEVVRPGNQLDRSVNLSQQFGGALVGAAAPLPQYQRSEYYAHGLSFGVAVKY